MYFIEFSSVVYIYHFNLFPSLLFALTIPIISNQVHRPNISSGNDQCLLGTRQAELRRKNEKAGFEMNCWGRSYVVHLAR